MDSRLVDTALGRLRTRSRGSGGAGRETIVFWPSLLMTSAMWATQADHFGTGRQVILIDPPGHGGSERLTAPFTFADCAQCIVDVLDAFGVPRAHFVGNSWGGMIGGTFAARHPQRLGKAVLMNCTASAAGRRQRLEYGLLLRMATLLGGIRPPLTRSVLKAFLGPTTFRTRPGVVDFVRATVESADVRSAGWAVRSVVPDRPDQRSLLAEVTSPVLVVAGAEDTTFPVPETKAMADAIPGARFVVLDCVAHLAALENPGLVNRLVADFLTN